MLQCILPLKGDMAHMMALEAPVQNEDGRSELPRSGEALSQDVEATSSEELKMTGVGHVILERLATLSVYFQAQEVHRRSPDDIAAPQSLFLPSQFPSKLRGHLTCYLACCM